MRFGKGRKRQETGKKRSTDQQGHVLSGKTLEGEKRQAAGRMRDQLGIDGKDLADEDRGQNFERLAQSHAAAGREEATQAPFRI